LAFTERMIDIMQQIEKIFGLKEFHIKRFEIHKEEVYLYVQVKAKKARCLEMATEK
jgi:hypothetical protein